MRSGSVRLEQVLGRLRRRSSESSRPPFHVFATSAGAPLLYDPAAGALLALSEAASRSLRAIEEGASPEEAARVAGAGVEEADALALEIAAVLDAGLLAAEPSAGEEARDAAARAQARAAPRRLMLLVQTSCNLKCGYCYEAQSGFHRTGRAMDLATACRAVDDLLERSARRPHVEVTFFGGEPLLNFAVLREAVSHALAAAEARGKSVSFQITTNGVLLTDDAIDFLVRHRFGVMLSLDGPPDLHDLHRVDHAGRGSGARVLAAARRLVDAQRRAGVREATIRATMTHESHDASALRAWFAAQGFARVVLGAAGGRAGERGPGDLLDEDLPALAAPLERSIAEYLRWVDGAGLRPGDAEATEEGVRHVMRALRTPAALASVGCGVGHNMRAVTESGAIYPCHRFAGEEAFAIGTLDGGLDRVRLEGFYRDLLAVKEEHCGKCWARFTCGGQCAWTLTRRDGSFVAPDEATCASIRRSHEGLLGLVHELARRGRLPEGAERETEEGAER